MEQYSFSFYCDDSWSFSTLLSRMLRRDADGFETTAGGRPERGADHDSPTAGDEPGAHDQRQLCLLA